MLFASVACPDPAYCCCRNQTQQSGYSNSTDLARALGKMELDWMSTDEYYDVSIEHYKAVYQSRLYPHLSPRQKVLLVPFAAYCEIGCAINSTIGGPGAPAADARVLSSAQAHYQWASEDKRVAGLIVYRLKNLWQKSAGKDVCKNPSGTGLGLVDRCGQGGSGGYAMPRSVGFYTAAATEAEG